MFVVPQEPGDAEMLAERIAPRLQHANSAVVLTAVKVIVYLMNYMAKEEDIVNMCKKLSPPLGEFSNRKSHRSLQYRGAMHNLTTYVCGISSSL
jgi:vesicle coat complex subunit